MSCCIKNIACIFPIAALFVVTIFSAKISDTKLVENPYRKFYSFSEDPLYLFSTVILEQEVRVIRFDSKGVPMAYATSDHIGVNEDFLNLPMTIQKALIAHELGHLFLNHVNNESFINREWYFLLWGTVDPRERDADLFSVDMLGERPMLFALEYAYDQCKLIESYDCMIEAIIRHAIIVGKICI